MRTRKLNEEESLNRDQYFINRDTGEGQQLIDFIHKIGYWVNCSFDYYKLNGKNIYDVSASEIIPYFMACRAFGLDHWASVKYKSLPLQQFGILLIGCPYDSDWRLPHELSSYLDAYRMKLKLYNDDTTTYMVFHKRWSSYLEQDLIQNNIEFEKLVYTVMGKYEPVLKFGNGGRTA